jgi:transcriptional regulator with XRE-family HTH domain
VKKRGDILDIEVGRRIRARRLARHMSQTDLASRLGLTFQQVQKYEKGTNRVGAGRLHRIAEILDVSVSHFFPDAHAQASDDQQSRIVEFLVTARAVRLLKAYSQLADPKLQQSIVSLVEELAGDAGRA